MWHIVLLFQISRCPSDMLFFPISWLSSFSIVLRGTYHSTPQYNCRSIPIVSFPLSLFLQAGIDMSGPATLRSIAGDVYKITLLLTMWTNIRQCWCGYGVTAIGTSPVSHSAFWTDISDKFSNGCITAQCTFQPLFFLFHSNHIRSLFFYFYF